MLHCSSIRWVIFVCNSRISILVPWHGQHYSLLNMLFSLTCHIYHPIVEGRSNAAHWSTTYEIDRWDNTTASWLSILNHSITIAFRELHKIVSLWCVCVTPALRHIATNGIPLVTSSHHSGTPLECCTILYRTVRYHAFSSSAFQNIICNCNPCNNLHFHAFKHLLSSYTFVIWSESNMRDTRISSTRKEKQ